MRRTRGMVALVCLTALGCSSGESSDAFGTGGGTSGSGGSSASGGTGGSGAKDAGTDGPVTVEGGWPDTGGGDGPKPDAPEPPCAPGLFECVGNAARVCLSDLTWGPAEDCGSLVCAPYQGCVNCMPNSSTCVDGATVEKCKNDGSGTFQYDCDPVVGSVCEAGACTGPCAPEAIGKSYIGCDYFPTVTANSQLGTLGNLNNLHYAVAVSNTTASPAEVTITQGGATVTTRTVGASSVEIIPLPWTALRTPGASQLVAGGSYRLRSTQPVTVYQFSPLEYADGSGGWSMTNDASLLFPRTAWGTSYVVAARNTWLWSSANLPGFYAVVASEDATTITITPSATGTSIRAGGGVPATGAGVVTLNQGDVLQVLSGTSASDDVTGTRIDADKPIQVIAGHDCTFVPASVGYCDHLEESMFPVNTLAQQYVVTPPSLPGQTQPKAFFARVIAVEPNTTLTYDPPNPAWPTALANAGDYVELDASTTFLIEADKRVLVAQYMKGQDAGGGSGDPAMALAVATLQFREDYLFHSPMNYEHNYVNLIAPASASVTLDGAPVAGFEPIGATGLSVARVKFANSGDGNHRVTASERVGITVYGYGQYTSYWYPGGLNLRDL